MKTAVIGFPRIGSQRELKFASEKYFKHSITLEELNETAKELRKQHWLSQKNKEIDFISSHDFSFYDNVLDTAVLFNIIPQRYKELKLNTIDTYFAMARGYQGENGDVKALAMKKWFNTNYHYMVPEIDDNTQICLSGTKIFDEYKEASQLGIETKPMLIGPFTLLKLAKTTGKKDIYDFVESLVQAYIDLFSQLNELKVNWLQLDEPYLVFDLSKDDITLFVGIYKQILEHKKDIKVLLQTYFGDVRDCYQELMKLSFDGIGLDFIEGKETFNLIQENGFDQHKTLFAGVINGKNIWANHYQKTYGLIQKLKTVVQSEIVLNTSCSLLHVPYTIDNETKINDRYKKYFAFANEKLKELNDLKQICTSLEPKQLDIYQNNINLFKEDRQCTNDAVQQRVQNIKKEQLTRLPEFSKREAIQKEEFQLPLFPTTTIGSFPQTKDVKLNRRAYRRGEISEASYIEFNKKKIAECVALQEEIGLDVLVHGEFERNDMVEYFGECLNGFLFTEKAWVQSYGTRCVKPPIIWGDVSREKPITVEWSAYAQSLTDKPMKGMLTGPVTILNWSFPREDISIKESTYQIALAIRDEVLDLEANGIRIIQIDEAALREKLPLRKSDWYSEYLDWAIPAFRLVHSGVKPTTQIHTHMCYSEFNDIIPAIDSMDADVITFEASRSDLQILDALKENHFQTEVGPGVYDIHSPRIPSTNEIKDALDKMIDKISVNKLWVNPDCGLKTRGEAETKPSLQHLVEVAKQLRSENE